MSLRTGIAAYWNLDGNSLDASGNGNNGTDTGITYSVANGKINSGAGFNGTTSRIALGTTSIVNSGLTISAWVKSSTFTNGVGNVILSKSNNISAATDSYYFILNGTGASTAQFSTFAGDGTTNKYYTSTAVVTLSSFTHVAITYDLSNFRMYVNGALVETSGSLALGSINIAASNLFMGSFAGTLYWFNGAMDEVGLWNRALAGSEINVLYRGGSGNTYPFIDYLITLSSSIMNASSYFTTLSFYRAYIAALAVSVMNGASRFATFTSFFNILTTWKLFVANVASWKAKLNNL